MTDDIKTYTRLLRMLKPYWRLVAAAITSMACSAALEPVLPALMRPLIDQSLIEKNTESMWTVPLLIVLTFIVKGLVDYVSSVASQTIAQKVIADLRRAVFEKQLDLPMRVHRLNKPGRMTSRIIYDTSQVGEAVSTAWVTIVRDTLVLIGLFAFLFYTAWQLTLMLICIAPMLAMLIKFINARIRKHTENVQTSMGKLTGVIQEALAGLREIKVFGAHGTQSMIFDGVNQKLRREQTRVIRSQSLNVPIVQILAASSVATIAFAATKLSQASLLSPGEFVAFVAGMSMVFEPVRRLTNVNSALQRGLVAAKGIFHTLDQPGEQGSYLPLTTTQRIQPNVKSKNSVSMPFKGSDSVLWAPPEIHFDGVGFAYGDENPEQLKPFSARIAGGSSALLVGASGSGKSTLLHLLCGFESPTFGQLRINGTSIADIPIAMLRRNISLIGQSFVLFDCTVRENLLLANQNASDADIWKALNLAHADEFVNKLKYGLSTRLGSLGSGLSGGERQRLAIARAFLKDASILLLDEPTSALDRESAVSVIDGLNSLMKGRTTIVVSHSLESLPNTNQTIKL